MTIAAQKMTATEFLALPEVQAGAWLELVNGEVIVSPRPNRQHSYVGLKLSTLLDTYIEANGLGVLYPEVDTIFDADTVRVPDLLFYQASHMPPVDDSPNISVPHLCIEILSPSNARADRVEKFLLYQSKGVKYYWIIDPEERMLEAYMLEGARYVSIGRAADSQVIKLAPFPNLEIPLAKLWPAKPA